MKAEYPLVVIGAGPAGISAALQAASHGVKVALLDDQPGPGGQIYRNLEKTTCDRSILGADYFRGEALLRRLRQSGVDYFAQSSVWYLDRHREIGLLSQTGKQRLRAQTIVIAGGAQERPMPFPGWTLPGVMTAGGAQTLLKSSAVLPDDGVVLAGRGPLLLLLAQQLLRAGVRIGALLETTPAGAVWRALPQLPAALLAADYLIKGRYMIKAIRRSGTPWYRIASLQAQGESVLQTVKFEVDGKLQCIDTELLLIHDGIIPEVHLAQAAGCELAWHSTQQCWHAKVDAWGESSQSGIFVIGDAAGINGAEVARLDGELAGMQVAQQLGFLTVAERDKMARPIDWARQRHRRIRPMLDAYYGHGQNNLPIEDDTLVCRCESIRLADLNAVISMGCTGPNQAKAFTRCGMGACQGRFCSASVERVFADLLGESVGEIGHYRARPPLKPITLGQLADPGEIEA